MSDKLLTIGMATYDDYDGVFFSIQALRMYHPLCNAGNVEFIVLDSNPDKPHGDACKLYMSRIPNGRYIPIAAESQSSFNKYKIIDHADGKYVLIIDCHVLIQSGGIDSLVKYFQSIPNCKNLVQGPLLYDDLQNYSTHFDPKWSGDMYGVWATNKAEYDAGVPFQIFMQGMGLLALEKSVWGGINSAFRGFGGEEGYIAEKFRSWGGKNICLPSLGWNHRFNRPNGVPYRLILEDRIWNYFIGWLEITQDPDHEFITAIYEYFKDKIPPNSIDSILQQAKKIALPQ